MIIPEYYTFEEGGKWKRWPQDIRMDSPKDFHLYSKRGESSVTIKDLQVHAIAFGEVAAGAWTFLRWDCVNGFNN